MPSVNDSPSTPTTTTPVLRKLTKKTTPDSVKPTELTTPVLSVKPCSTTEPTEPGSPRNELRDKEALKECFNASLSSPATTDAVTTAPLNQAPLLSYPNPFRRVQEPVEPDQQQIHKYRDWEAERKHNKGRKLHIGTANLNPATNTMKFERQIDSNIRKRDMKRMWKFTSRPYMKTQYGGGLQKEYRKFFEPLDGGEDACTQQHSNYKVFRKRRISNKSTTVQTSDKKLSSIDKPVL